MIKSNSKERTSDPAAKAMMDSADSCGIGSAFTRHDEQEPRCGFGELGICCRICEMGPCRVSPFGDGPTRGVCGADADTIAARHLIRQVAAGVAAHSDHGHDIVKTLLLVAKGEAQGYTIKNEARLLELATEWGIDTDGRAILEVARELAEKGMAEFNSQDGEIAYPAMRAPAETVKNWRKLGLIPVGVEHEIVETLHRTHEGVDADYKNLIMHGLRTSMGDGWAGAMLATDISDVLFGTPEPVRSQVNLGVLRENEVNIVVHGHEPTLSEMIVAASSDPELLALAKEKGAEGNGTAVVLNRLCVRELHCSDLLSQFLAGFGHQLVAVAAAFLDAGFDSAGTVGHFVAGNVPQSGCPLPLRIAAGAGGQQHP